MRPDRIVIRSAKPHLKVVWLALCPDLMCKCNPYNLLTLGLLQVVVVSDPDPTVINKKSILSDGQMPQLVSQPAFG